MIKLAKSSKVLSVIRESISIVFVFLSFILLTACHEKQTNINKKIQQAETQLSVLRHLFEPISLPKFEFSDLSLDSLADPFKSKIISQPITSLSAFLNKHWVLDGYVKHGARYSSIFIRSNALDQSSSSEGEMMLLSNGDKLFDQQWVVKRLGAKKITFLNPVLGKTVSKQLDG